jgi:gluconolactonase
LAAGLPGPGFLLWHDGALLVSSPVTNTIYRWNPIGRVDVFRVKSGYAGVDIGCIAEPGADGLALDGHGRLLICQRGNRRVIRVEPRGNITVIADGVDGQRFDAPRHVVVHSDGTIVFSDATGVFAIRDANINCIADTFNAPSGLAFDPEESVLYIADCTSSGLKIFACAGSEFTMLSELTTVGANCPASYRAPVVVGADHTLYVGTPEGICVISGDGNPDVRHAAIGSVRGLAFDDRGALYAAAGDAVYRLLTPSARQKASLK